MQQKQKLTQRLPLIVVLVLAGFVPCYAQTTSSTTATGLQGNHAQQDSETLKALEIANIRLAAANETIKLLNDRLTAKDEIIKAKDGLLSVRDEQLALAKSAIQDRSAVNTGDARLLSACENQLAKADAEIHRLRYPGFLRSLFDTKTITGAAVGFGIGRVSK